MVSIYEIQFHGFVNLNTMRFIYMIESNIVTFY